MKDDLNNLTCGPPCTAAVDCRRTFERLAACATEVGDHEVATAAASMADLLTVAVLFSEDADSRHRADEIVEFCQHRALPVLQTPELDEQLPALMQEFASGYSDCLALLAPEERFRTATADPDGAAWRDADSGCHEEGGGITDAPAAADMPDLTMDLEQILASLAEDDSASQQPAPAPVAAPVPAQVDQNASTAAPRTTVSPLTTPVSPEQIDDPEMVAAYADDAQQCLAEMEASLLNLESGHARSDALQNFCRQLHTLKGASGTVGLAQLARYLHDLESYIETAAAGDIDVDVLLQGVDTVRDQLSTLGVCDFAAPTTAVSSPEPQSAESAAARHPASAEAASGVAAASGPVTGGTVTSGKVAGGNTASGKTAGGKTAGEREELFVRVEASRLERLMDLLAELVMLRNRRDTCVGTLKFIHDELNRCASRTRSLATSAGISQPSLDAFSVMPSAELNRSADGALLLSRSLDEVAQDTAELGRSLQAVVDPLVADNSAVSHLIGRFRQDLMELRRLPVSGLFQRLQRGIREAARAEHKQIEVIIEGQGARAERAVQERLFEPLLHLVRNAVSHGIEATESRVRSGKSAAGTITLSARSDASSLCIEVRDDGQGLDEGALDRRGRELGLLPVGEAVSQNRLWSLIFHPGFSTRASVSEISGRGVGMDVVDSWVRRLRGRIEVDSVAGRGTTFRLQIPLRSAVEHAMVVRVGGQLFALPMHTIRGTSDSNVPTTGLSGTEPGPDPIPLSRVLRLGTGHATRHCWVMLRGPSGAPQGGKAQPGPGLTIAVDAVVGVEEVVVRSLPSLLQQNDLFAGVTLSGRAETVLVLDVPRLMELIAATDVGHTPRPVDGVADMEPTPETTQRSCILVVDDSVAVRRSLSRRLQAAGYEVAEATNGRDALDQLKGIKAAAVVTDIDMPSMNGLELLQEICRRRTFDDLPVVVLTSRQGEELPIRSNGLHPAVVLNKPVTDETISAIIDVMAARAASKPDSTSPTNAKR
ncbi:MAG: response regulator [Fuerstiella sp.]